MKNKLDTYVDFPVDNLDLSAYITHGHDKSCNRYVLYAISNHYGSMGGGHYTAFVHVSVGCSFLILSLSFLSVKYWLTSFTK